MESEDSLLRLDLLVLLCQQLEHHVAEELMLLAIEDPTLFSAEVLTANEAGRVRLPNAHVQVLRRDLEVHPVAV